MLSERSTSRGKQFQEERERNEEKMYSPVSNLRLRLLGRGCRRDGGGGGRSRMVEVENKEVATGGSRLYYGNYMINTTRP